MDDAASILFCRRVEACDKLSNEIQDKMRKLLHSGREMEAWHLATHFLHLVRVLEELKRVKRVSPYALWTARKLLIRLLYVERY